MDWQSIIRSFRTAVIWVGTAAGAIALWNLRLVLLVAFAAVLLAILLRAVTHWICRWTRVADGLGLALAIVILLLIGLGVVWVFGAEISSQTGELVHRLQDARGVWMGLLHKHGINADKLLNQTLFHLKGLFTGVISASLDVLGGGIVVAVSAVYLAAQPGLYRCGAARLFGAALRTRIIEGLDSVANSLKLWLLAQLLLMLIVGLLAFVAASLLGLPNAIALGLISAFTEIVPYVGPFIGGIPAVLVALPMGASTALWTVAAYVGIHIIEGYVAGPPLERYFVRIPPALVLIGILASATLFGPLGIMLAAPLTAAIFTAVKTFYLPGTLHHRTRMPAS